MIATSEEGLLSLLGDSYAVEQLLIIHVCSSRPLTQNSGEDDGSNGNYDDKIVHLVTRVGNGVWVTYNEECSLHLFHLETLMRLQEIDLSRIIRDFKQGTIYKTWFKVLLYLYVSIYQFIYLYNI